MTNTVKKAVVSLLSLSMAIQIAALVMIAIVLTGCGGQSSLTGPSSVAGADGGIRTVKAVNDPAPAANDPIKQVTADSAGPSIVVALNVTVISSIDLCVFQRGAWECMPHEPGRYTSGFNGQHDPTWTIRLQSFAAPGTIDKYQVRVQYQGGLFTRDIPIGPQGISYNDGEIAEDVPPPVVSQPAPPSVPLAVVKPPCDLGYLQLGNITFSMDQQGFTNVDEARAIVNMQGCTGSITVYMSAFGSDCSTCTMNRVHEDVFVVTGGGIPHQIKTHLTGKYGPAMHHWVALVTEQPTSLAWDVPPVHLKMAVGQFAVHDED